MSSNWLHAYLNDAVRRNLCTAILCTTCGATDFRRGLLDALAAATETAPRQRWDRETAIEVAAALAHVEPTDEGSLTLVPAVRCLLFDLWSAMSFRTAELEALLASSWAGDVLRAMKEHYAARQAEQQARAEMQAPENVKKRREEKRQLKQAQHEHRLALKKERDRIWRPMYRKAD